MNAGHLPNSQYSNQDYQQRPYSMFPQPTFYQGPSIPSDSRPYDPIHDSQESPQRSSHPNVNQPYPVSNLNSNTGFYAQPQPNYHQNFSNEQQNAPPPYPSEVLPPPPPLVPPAPILPSHPPTIAPYSPRPPVPPPPETTSVLPPPLASPEYDPNGVPSSSPPPPVDSQGKSPVNSKNLSKKREIPVMHSLKKQVVEFSKEVLNKYFHEGKLPKEEYKRIVMRCVERVVFSVEKEKPHQMPKNMKQLELYMEKGKPRLKTMVKVRT